MKIIMENIKILNKGIKNMKKILFATKNPAKVKYYADELKKYGYEIYTISDLNVDIDVEENGKDGELGRRVGYSV